MMVGTSITDTITNNSHSCPNRSCSGIKKFSPAAPSRARMAGHLGSVFFLAMCDYDECNRTPPHEGCSSQFVACIHPALDYFERANQQGQARTWRERIEWGCA